MQAIPRNGFPYFAAFSRQRLYFTFPALVLLFSPELHSKVSQNNGVKIIQNYTIIQHFTKLCQSRDVIYQDTMSTKDHERIHRLKTQKRQGQSTHKVGGYVLVCSDLYESCARLQQGLAFLQSNARTRSAAAGQACSSAPKHVVSSILLLNCESQSQSVTCYKTA